MSKYVTRKFVSDIHSIVSVSNGVILRQNIYDFVANNKAWLEKINQTGDNVGWCTTSTMLMVTEDDKVLRIDKCMYDHLRNDSDTTVISEDSISTELKYSSSRYSDEYLRIDTEYKNQLTGKYGDMLVVVMNLGDNERVIVSDRSRVFIVRDGVLFTIGLNYSEWLYGSNYMHYLKSTGDNVGYCPSKGDYLLISNDKIQLINKYKARDILGDRSTKRREITDQCGAIYAYTYDRQWYPDGYIGATTDYK